METQFETDLIHAGEMKPFVERAISLPIFQSSTYEYSGEDDYNDIRYIRLNNTPNHLVLGHKLAQLEKTEVAVVTASGMGAISTALLSLVGHGEHVLAQSDLYGGSDHFFRGDFPRFGRSVTFFDNEKLDDLEKLLRPETRLIYVESISNPLLKVPDLKRIARFAREKGLISMIDNTFPSPFNFNPATIGFGVVLHSATKYLNGHTDIVAGVIATSKEQMRKIVPVLNHLGASLDPHACFLLHRGMKTLSVRMRWQNESASKVAHALVEHPHISKVTYPGLKTHPNHARATELFRGFSGMLTFEYKGTVDDLDRGLKKLKLFALAPSLGGVESLITRPATTSHSGIPTKEREALGVKDTLVRVSVGLESPEDLIADLFANL